MHRIEHCRHVARAHGAAQHYQRRRGRRARRQTRAAGPRGSHIQYTLIAFITSREKTLHPHPTDKGGSLEAKLSLEFLQDDYYLDWDATKSLIFSASTAGTHLP